MAEGITVACRLDNLTACRVNVPTGHTGLAGSNACKLCVQHRVVHSLHLVGDMTDRDRARHIRAVAVINTAEVHRHEIARPDGLFTRYAMRLGAVRARNDDRVKRHVLRTVVQPVSYTHLDVYKRQWLDRGTVTVPDYEFSIPEEAKYFVSIGVLPASVFDTTKMTEDVDYEINYEVSEKGYLRIWATSEQLNTLVKYITGTNAGLSGDVSRLNFAKLICQLTGRDTDPDTSAYSGHIQYFTDSGSSEDLITEVSHEHDLSLIHICRQDVNEMPDWEIQPKKHKYEVGERVLVRPAIIDGIWAKATVSYTHLDVYKRQVSILSVLLL